MEHRFELAPGDYIGDEFRAKMQAWCDEFFVPVPEIARTPRKERTTPRKPRRNLGDLLDAIKTTFSDLTIPVNTMSSWVDADMRIGLRKLGPHIPEFDWQGTTPEEWKWIIEDDGPRPQVAPSSLSSMMFLGTPKASETYESQRSDIPPSPGEFGHQEFLFAVRLKNLPALVEKRRAIANYQCGIVYRFSKKSLVWTNFYISVDQGIRTRSARAVQRAKKRSKPDWWKLYGERARSRQAHICSSQVRLPDFHRAKLGDDGRD